ncbi:MAG: YihY/virulence factor BrkB family protein [Comamonadaceae bacterium]|nr:MAG: YihY/virulence factor BrkB family protein [Comamonadaceae bacterium]
MSHLKRHTLIADLALPILVGICAAWVTSRFIPAQQSARDSDYEDKTKHRVRAGALASEPHQIPAKGWLEVARRTYHEVDRDRVRAVAAGVTFYGLLALFPALTAFVSLYGLVAEPATIAGQVALIDGFLPAGSSDFLRDQLVRITRGGETELSIALVVSVSLAIWSANAGVKAVFDALNVAYGEDEKRGFIKLNLVSLAFTTGTLCFVLTSVGAVAVIPVMLDYVYLGGTTEWIISIGRWPVLIVALILGLSILYRYGPSRDEAQWSWVSPGAIFASVSWLAGSLLLSWYVANFEDYNKTYGTIGAVIGLLTWMWLSATIVLVGAELNSESERQTDEDTTRGPPVPIGMRGADAADRKG